MRIFKHKSFQRWAKTEGVTDLQLLVAVTELAQGLFDANLGGGLYKKRIAREGQGKRGGYRTLLAFKNGTRAIFIFGFSKSERANIAENEENIFKRLAKEYLNATDIQIETLLNNKELIEIK